MADVFWVGGTGAWSEHATHWSNTSGHSGGIYHGSVPGADDNVIFDILSSAAEAAYTMTIDIAATCLDFTMDGPSATDATKITWAGTSALAISGSFNLSGGTAGITRSYKGVITFNATAGTKTITTNGVAIYSFVLNGAGGTFQLADSLTIQGLTRTNGVFDTTTNLTTVTIATVSGATILGDYTGTSSFYNLSRTGAAIKTDAISINGNWTITHTVAWNGDSAINRLLFWSSVIGTPRTITITGTTGNTFSNIALKGIAMVTGGADLDLSTALLCPGLASDCGENSGITFTTGVSQYWYKASGNDSWSTLGNWYLGTGGLGGAGRVPLAQDTAILDDLSFGAAGMTLTQDMPRIPTTTFCGDDGAHPVANTPTFTTSLAASVFGSLTLTPLMTLTASTQPYLFDGRAAGMPVGGWTLTSAGLTWAKDISPRTYGGTLKLLDDLITTGSIYVFGMVTFNTNGKSITCANFRQSSGGDYTLIMDNTLWTITGTGTVAWSPFTTPGVSTFTLSATGSTVKFTDTTNTALTFAGASKTYNNLWFARGASTATNTIIGTNIFADIKDTGTEAHSLLFTTGTTNTVTTWSVNGSLVKLITVVSTTTTNAILAKAGGGTVLGSYLSVDYITGSPANTWYMIASTDGGHNTNVYFVTSTCWRATMGVGV